MINKIETPVSFLKPENLVETERAFFMRQTDIKRLIETQNAEISRLVEQQKAEGLQVFTEGGFRDLYEGRDFWMMLQGVAPTNVISGHVYQNQNAGEVIPMVTSTIAYNPQHQIFDNFAFLLKEAGDGSTVRLDIPAPSFFYLELVRNGWIAPGVYANPRLLADDIAKAYNLTLHALYNQGCRRVLFVDCSWARLCDRLEAKRLVQGGINIETLPEILKEINEQAINDLPQDMHIILYTPVKTRLRVDCEEIVKVVCAHKRVNAFMIDVDKDSDVLFEFMKLIPSGKEVILGLDDPQHPQLIDTDEVKSIISKVSRQNQDVDIRLSTKGGFKNNTDSIDCSSVDDHHQWRKINNLLSIAQSLG